MADDFWICRWRIVIRLAIHETVTVFDFGNNRDFNRYFRCFECYTLEIDFAQRSEKLEYTYLERKDEGRWFWFEQENSKYGQEGRSGWNIIMDGSWDFAWK